MTAYFVAANGAQTGPFTVEEIRSQCSRGLIQRDTLMWREGLADWQSAEQVLQGTGIPFAGEEKSAPSPPPFSDDSSHPYTELPNQELQFSVPAASLSAGRGISWMAEGWKLFIAAPGMWIAALLIWFLAQVALGYIPVLGTLGGILLGPSFAVGMLAFAHGISSTGNADLGALIAGFKDKFGALVVLALLYFLMLLAVAAIGAVLFFMLIGSTGLSYPNGPDQVMSTLLAGGILKFALLFLIVLGLLALLLTAYVYAPALVFFADQSASEAMKQSFAACWKNWLPLLVTGLIAIAMLIIGAMPFGLGLLVVMPVLFAASYASFKDMFGR